MKEDLGAMTVNERLFITGLLHEFDKAIAKKDIEQIRIILRKVEVNEESIEAILKSKGLI